MDTPDKQILIEEYRQLMESQRDNTRIAYSWMASIILVLCSVLFLFGLTANAFAVFIPALILGTFLCLIWVGLTEVFARYTRLRINRIDELSEQLGIPPLQAPKSFNPLHQARIYVYTFAVIYIIAWILRLILGFLI